MRLLTVLLDGDEVACVNEGQEPCELTPSRQINRNAVLEFVDGMGQRHVHPLTESGWAHISVRVHEGLTCQADCAVTDCEVYDPQELLTGGGRGIRFQPFFLPGSKGNTKDLVGQGLFRRGLHFSGTVTPSSVRLACECDHCSRSFQIQSFHSGFSNAGYLYSRSGAYTLLIDERVPGSPPALGKPDMAALAALEEALPPAPDGTRFGYMNPFRCPHCRQPYIDFHAHPGLREGEYYGNCHLGSAPIHYEQLVAPPKKPSKGLLAKIFGR